MLQTGRARALMGDWDGALAALAQVGSRSIILYLVCTYTSVLNILNIFFIGLLF